MSAVSKTKRGKALGRSGGKKPRKTASRTQAPRAPAVRPRRKRPPPVTHEVLGLRCHVREVMLLDATLVLMDDVDGKQFALPLPVLVGRDALADIEKGQAVWLSVRVEKARSRRRDP